MIITKEFLKNINACDGYEEWFGENKMYDKPDIQVLKLLIKQKHLEQANWLIVRCMDYNQYVAYAIYAAEQVFDIFEKKYPDDNRPRLAIEAAKKCLKNPSEENKRAAYSAADAAAYSAADAAYAAADAAAYSAADAAAYSAADAAAYAAVDAAYAAAYAAADEAYSAANAAYSAASTYSAASARAQMQIKILKYGLKLMRSQNEPKKP